MQSVLYYLRRIVGGERSDALSDGALLERFIDRHDEAAFEALLQQHGPMVLGLCRRILRDADDAEDAFQATFLILACKAHAIRRREALGSWLYGVAYRTAMRAKARRVARRIHERQAVAMASSEPRVEVSVSELQAILDEEIRRLPERYRAPIVLCYLEGKSYDEAAQQLNWPKGTIASRLARARERLRGRLLRRGVVLPTSVSLAVLTESAAPAAMPSLLVSSTLRAAAALITGQALVGCVRPAVIHLMEGVLRSMFLTQVKLAVGLLTAVGLLLAGVGVYAYQALSVPPQAKTLEHPARHIVSEIPPQLVPTWKERWTLRCDFGSARAVAIAPDGKTMAVGYDAPPNNGVVKLWNLTTGREDTTLEAKDRLQFTPDLPMSIIEAVHFSPDGKLLLATTTTNRQAVVLWQTEDYRQLPPLESYVRDSGGAVFSPDSRRLAGASYSWAERNGKVVLDKLEVKVWDVASGKEETSWRSPGNRIMTVAYAPDNETVAWSHLTLRAQGSEDANEGEPCAVRLHNLRTGQDRVIEEGPSWFSAAMFSRDGKLLAAIAHPRKGKQDEVVLWDVTSGNPQVRLKGITGRLSALAISRDGQTLATAGEEQVVRLWDAITGKERAALRGHTGYILSLAFSQDGKTLVSGSQDKSVKVWQLQAVE